LVPLLPPINPGLTPHAHSHHTRDLWAADIPVHRDLPYPTDDDPAD
jgi:hypothetical protein